MRYSLSIADILTTHIHGCALHRERAFLDEPSHLFWRHDSLFIRKRDLARIRMRVLAQRYVARIGVSSEVL